MGGNKIQRSVEKVDETASVGMFVIQIEGPTSQEAFAQRFSSDIRPYLAAYDISVVAAHNSSNFYIYGQHKEDPVSVVQEIVDKVGWKIDKTIFLIPIPVAPPSGFKKTCDMPYNYHSLGSGETHGKCSNGHLISGTHNVARCPVCGYLLQ